MNRLRSLLHFNFPAPRWAVYGVIALASLTGAGVIAGHYWPDLRWIAAPEDLGPQRPLTLPQTKIVEKMVPKVVTRQVVVYEPNPKQVAKLENTYDLKLKEAGRQLLTEVTIPKLENGGTAIVTVNEAGATEVKVAPARASFFQLGGNFEVGAGMVYAAGHGQGFTIHAGKDLGRVWKIHVKVDADLDVYAGQTQGRAAILGVVRF